MSNTQKAIGFYNQDGTATIYGNTGGRGGGSGASTIRIVYDESPATKSHAVGTYIYFNSHVYKVISAIIVGDTIAVGTNIAVDPDLLADDVAGIEGMPGGGGGGKQPSIISVDASATVNNATPTATKAVTITQGDGTLSATSSDTSVATVTVSGSNVIITGVGTGSATITVSLSETANYYGVSATIAVTADFVDFFTDWLTAGGLNPASYADLDAVLADEIVVRKLFTIHDAVDVIVDEVSAISSSDLTKIFNNDYVAKWVNLRDYALDTLYANSTIAGYMDTADKYFYGEWVITDSTTTPVTWGPKGNVPVMTSDTAPYGEVFAKDYASGYDPYKVFDGDYATFTYSPNASVSDYEWYIGYKFTNPVCVKEVKSIIAKVYSVANGTIKIQGSNDGSTWTDVITGISYNTSDTSTNVDISIPNNTNYYLYYRFHTTGLAPAMRTLQFYGREMKVSVPTMTSNTSPYGEAFGDSYFDGQPYYQAFDNNSNMPWSSNTDNYNGTEYIGYDFEQQKKIKSCGFYQRSASVIRTCNVKIQGSNDKFVSDVHDLSALTQVDMVTTAAIKEIIIPFTVEAFYRYYRVLFVSKVGSWSGFNPTCSGLQFYGFDYSEYDWDTVKPRHYIYDHGIELETLASDFTYSGWTNEEPTKNDYSIELKSSANRTLSAIGVNSPIDTTQYDLFRIHVIGGVSVSSNSGFIYVSATKAMNNNIAYSGLTYLNHALDISSCNGNYYLSAQASDQRTCIVDEWWLE